MVCKCQLTLMCSVPVLNNVCNVKFTPSHEILKLSFICWFLDDRSNKYTDERCDGTLITACCMCMLGHATPRVFCRWKLHVITEASLL